MSKFNASTSPYYHNTKWRKLRLEIINEQKKCKSCNNSHHLHVDHIFEVENNEELFYFKDNLQLLCKSCHFIKTTEDKTLFKLSKKSNFKINISNNFKEFVLPSEDYGLSLEAIIFRTLEQHNKTFFINYDLNPAIMRLLINYICKNEKGLPEEIIIYNEKFIDIKIAMEYWLEQRNNWIKWKKEVV